VTKNDPIKALEEHVADRRRELEEAELCLDIARESW